MMRLNIYRNQREVEKTFEVEGYDLMYGTVEDIFGILEAVDLDKLDGGDVNIGDDAFKVFQDNRQKLNALILDIFPDMTADDLRKVKVKDLIPFFVELFRYVMDSFGKSKN
ncbi:MAG: hypothetical protein IKZ82_05935 [Clostridia bacterium]|nr:hypothetical protein [Clostridia bacterium]